MKSLNDYILLMEAEPTPLATADAGAMAGAGATTPSATGGADAGATQTSADATPPGTDAPIPGQDMGAPPAGGMGGGDMGMSSAPMGGGMGGQQGQGINPQSTEQIKSNLQRDKVWKSVIGKATQIDMEKYDKITIDDFKRIQDNLMGKNFAKVVKEKKRR